MSLSSAMNAAMSGLSAVGRATELVSENIANASTPGYGRRALALSAQGEGNTGVRVEGVSRRSDPVLVSYRRLADAHLANADAKVSFYSRLGDLAGGPDSSFSISTRIADLEASLLSASSRPDLAERLDDVAAQARDLTESLRNASEGVQDMRRQSDKAIGQMVETLNTGLARLQAVNACITRDLSSGNGVAALQDQRQQIIDEISELVPVTQVDRPRGQVALYSEGGAILIDGVAAEIGFETTGWFGPAQTLETGALGGLTINGIPVRTGSENGALRGGALGAEFARRDEWAVAAQADLDALARDLIERFQDPAVDATLLPGDPGLFTDGAGAFDPLDEIGISARIHLNPAADPGKGGDSWKLRDGLGAAAPGAPGNPSLLNALSNALTTPRPVPSGGFGSTTFSAANLATAIVSGTQQTLALAENDRSFALASQADLERQELAFGVDSDAELQSMLVLEQAYAANAQVLSAIDEMMAEILRI